MLDTNSEKDVRLERERFLNDLQQQVDNAILHREIVTFKSAGGGRYVAENALIESSQRAAKIRSGVRDQKDIILKNQKKESEVYISNSHDFKDLLVISYRKLGFGEEVIPSLVEKDLEHEYAHHVPVLGQPGVQIEYGVRFSYDPSMKARGMQPFVSVTGKIPYEIAKQFFKGPPDSSPTDNIEKSAFELPLHLRIIKAAREIVRRIPEKDSV